MDYSIMYISYIENCWLNVLIFYDKIVKIYDVN